jgi:ribose transport system substrate-binding protein
VELAIREEKLMTLTAFTNVHRAFMLATIASAVCLLGVSANADSKKPVIALSNSFYGNAWRHQMVDAFEVAAKQAKQDGRIADYVILNGDGTVSQQNSQLSALILKHVDVIAINAASESALNGVVKKACDADIKILAFDSLVTEPCATKLSFDFRQYSTEGTEWVVEKMGGKGNILMVRGVKGSGPEIEMYDATMAVLKKFPGIKVVAEIYGQSTDSIAQTAVSNVLPSLPHIDAVMDQGASYGVSQAFEQYGGEYADNMPIISGGGDNSNFINWWIGRRNKNGYGTISVGSTPGIGGAAFWLALHMAQGEKVPASITMPYARVTNENLDDYANMKPGEVISPTYSEDWVKKNVLK